jgi:hypothetical protein
MSRRRKKQPGCYCWSCGRRRANERFSGRGRRQHLCNDCKRLGKEELAFRQYERNIDRLLTWDGMIRRKCRTAFQRYLTHPDQRVREYAARVEQHNEERRREWREMREAERLEEEHLERDWDEMRPDDRNDEDNGKDNEPFLF